MRPRRNLAIGPIRRIVAAIDILGLATEGTRHAVSGRRVAAVLAIAPVGPVRAQPSTAVVLTPEQERGLEDARTMVREFHRIYKPLYAVDVAPASWVGAKDLTQMAGVGVVYSLAAGKLWVSPSFLTSPHRDLILGITLAYHVLRRPSTAGTLADLEREQRQQRLDATPRPWRCSRGRAG